MNMETLHDYMIQNGMLKQSKLIDAIPIAYIEEQAAKSENAGYVRYAYHKLIKEWRDNADSKPESDRSAD